MNSDDASFLDQFELLRFAVQQLELLGVRYFITGSMASITHGEIRQTNDIDIVVELSVSQVEGLCRLFPDSDFYVSKEAALEAIRFQGMFNIIHMNTSLKIDLIIPKPSPFNTMRMQRAYRVCITEDEGDLPGSQPVMSSPEDSILSKLEFYKMGESDKHLRDITGILKISGDRLDRDYLREWAVRLEVDQLWDAVLERVKSSGS